MKKVNLEFITQLLLGLGGIALMVVGAIMFIGHFFQPDISLFQAEVITALGAILFSSVGLYFKFLEIVNVASDGIEKITKATETYKVHDDRVSAHSDYFPSLDIQKIIINEDTTPEEIEDLKKHFPGIENQLGGLLDLAKGKQSKTKAVPTAIEMMTISQLEQELKNAISLEDYKHAANIKNEINKRK